VTMPGFTAVHAVHETYISTSPSAAAIDNEGEPRVELQSCPVGVLAVCTPLIDTCLAYCWWSRLTGPRGCSACMSTCLDIHGWWGPSGLCKPCVTPGGSGTNICA
jgi:hypothetical protein